MAKSPHAPEYNVICALLFQERKRAGLTQSAVAERMGTPQSFVAKYEGAERRLDVIEFVRICEALDADPVELFTRLVAGLQDKANLLRLGAGR